MPEQDFSRRPARLAESRRETQSAAARDEGDSLSLVAVLFAGLGLAILLNTFVSLYPG